MKIIRNLWWRLIGYHLWLRKHRKRVGDWYVISEDGRIPLWWPVSYGKHPPPLDANAEVEWIDHAATYYLDESGSLVSEEINHDRH